MGQLMIGGRSGARLKYNLFVQPDEPDVKNGLWIKTPSAVSISDVLLKGSYVRTGHFSADTDSPFSQIPSNSYTQGGDFMGNVDAVSDGHIYLGFAHGSYPSSGYLLDYNLKTNTITNLGTAGFYIGGSIYNFQGIIVDGNGTPRYNLNTKTASGYPATTYPCVTSSVSYGYSYACACDNERVYIARTDATDMRVWTPTGGSSGTYTDLFTSTSLPEKPHFHNSIIVGGKLYVFSQTYGTRILNLSAGTVTTGANNPTNFCFLGYGQGGYPLKIGAEIFIFGLLSNISNTYAMISYNTETDTFTVYDSTKNYYKLFTYFSGKGILCNTFPTTTTSTTCLTGQFALESQAEPANTLCLLKGIKNQFWVLGTEKLMKALPKNSADILNSEYYSAPKPDFSIDDAWYYDTDFREYPTYIGDGTQWTKIKN